MSKERQNPPPPPSLPLYDGMETPIKFLKLKLPTFDGAPDLIELSTRRGRLKDCLKLCSPVNYTVKLAAHVFEKDAGFWRDMVKPKVGEALVTWAQSKGLLYETYYPKEIK